MARKKRPKKLTKTEIVDRIEDGIAESAFTKLLMVQQSIGDLAEIAAVVVRALGRGNRLFLIGNGGSAADAQHIAGELEGKFRKNRRPLPALALTTNTSTLTAVSNDYDFRISFARQLEAHARKGDVVIAISTSGNSPNVLEGVRAARKAGAATVGFTNRNGGKLARMVRTCFRAPTLDTQRTQECHILAGHVLCDVVERSLFG